MGAGRPELRQGIKGLPGLDMVGVERQTGLEGDLGLVEPVCRNGGAGDQPLFVCVERRKARRFLQLEQGLVLTTQFHQLDAQSMTGHRVLRPGLDHEFQLPKGFGMASRPRQDGRKLRPVRDDLIGLIIRRDRRKQFDIDEIGLVKLTGLVGGACALADLGDFDGRGRKGGIVRHGHLAFVGCGPDRPARLHSRPTGSRRQRGFTGQDRCPGLRHNRPVPGPLATGQPETE